MSEPKRRKIDEKEHKVVNDSIHGHITLHPLCLRIINTVQFQRLRNIKQMGGCYQVYPGAIHTRFEHSIGVCHLAGTLIRHLAKQLEEDQKDEEEKVLITDEDILCVEIAGLCHDLGHGPFSHLFEFFMKKVNADKGPDFIHWKHEQASGMMFDHLIKVNGIKLKDYYENFDEEDDLKFIKQLFNPPKDKDEYAERGKKKPFLYQIVANKASGIDVDKWDYFARDCHHLGMSSMFDHKRLTELSRLIKTDDGYEICFRDKEVQNIYEMFHVRHTLYRKACKHKTTQCVEEMIIDAFAKANESKSFKIAYTKDGKGDKCTIAKCCEDMHAYQNLTDNLFDDILRSHVEPNKADKSLEESQEILMRIIKRDLPILAGVARLKDLHIKSKIKEMKEAQKKEVEAKIKELKEAQEKEVEAKIKELKEAQEKEVEAKIKELKEAQEKEVKDKIKECMRNGSDSVDSSKNFIKIVEFNYSKRNNDPLKAVKFFDKKKEVKRIEPYQVACLLPSSFEERFVRIYSNDRNKQVVNKINEKFIKWCTDNAGIHDVQYLERGSC